LQKLWAHGVVMGW